MFGLAGGELRQGHGDVGPVPTEEVWLAARTRLGRARGGGRRGRGSQMARLVEPPEKRGQSGLGGARGSCRHRGDA